MFQRHPIYDSFGRKSILTDQQRENRRAGLRNPKFVTAIMYHTVRRLRYGRYYQYPKEQNAQNTEHNFSFRRVSRRSHLNAVLSLMYRVSCHKQRLCFQDKPQQTIILLYPSSKQQKEWPIYPPCQTKR